MRFKITNKTTGERVKALASRLVLNPFNGQLYEDGANVTALYELEPINPVVIDDEIKHQVIKRLSRSSNEQICFGVIWDQTIGKDRSAAVILPHDFDVAGCSDKRLRSLALGRLVKKELIFKGICSAHYLQHRCNRYSIIIPVCEQFIKK